MANPKGTKIGEKITRKELMDMMKSMRQKEFDKKSAENKKKVGQGGKTSTPAPKFNKDGIRIFSSVGTTSSNQRMPDLPRPGGIMDKVTKPKATPKATPKVKIPSMIGKVKVKSKKTGGKVQFK